MSEMVVSSAGPVDLEERDLIEEAVANGDLCSLDGNPCDMESVSDEYGADRDGNRGIRIPYRRCRKCEDVS